MKKTLVVMAGGMGSRFGGLKQVTPVDEDGNFIIDYSVYDAKRCGFDKVVFVIKEENLDLFEKTIGSRLKNQIEVCYAFQKLEDIPRKMDLSKREKPWGTVQAILCTRPYVDGPFAVINADDFYGYDAFYQASSFLEKHHEPFTYGSIPYPYGVTKSLEGAVKRGVLKFEGEKVTDIVESSIEGKDGNYLATPLNGSPSFPVYEDTLVSMNLFAFQNDIYELLEEYWKKFFQNDDQYILEHEALLPECLKENLESGKIQLYSQKCNSKWLGMTYKSDLEIVKKELIKLKNKKEYQLHLWR